MSEQRHVPEPGEVVYRPRPSWAPAFMAFGIAGMVCGIFAAGFALSPYIYAVIGAILVLAALRSMARGASGDFFRLPRRQRVRGAALPVETISSVPPKS